MGLKIFIYFPLIPVVNAPTRILVPEGQLEYGFMSLKDNWKMSIGTPEVVHELCLKRGKPIGSKDVPPQKRTQMSIGTLEEVHDKEKKINNNS